MYHRVCPDKEWHPSSFIVSESVFRSQMQYLAQHRYCTPNFSDVVGGSLERNCVGRNPVILTLDDGYLDNYEYAFPIIREFGFTALIFLVTDFRRRTNWWDSVPDLQAPLMHPEHVKIMKAAGIEMGSHTVSHRSLVALSDHDLREQLVDSKKVLEEIVGHPVPFLAYPYGDTNERVKRAAREAGYSCAFAGSSGPLYVHSDLFEIRRVIVENNSDDLYMFWLLSGLAKTYQYGKGLVKKMLGMHNPYLGMHNPDH